MADLLEFYGTECVHCHEMDPLIQRLEQETELKIERLEVWHNAKNAELLQKLDKSFCGGVPFFYNKKTGKWICGSTTYEKFKVWALGK
jgi:thiol-disulfide isomerase/thioredoxin